MSDSKNATLADFDQSWMAEAVGAKLDELKISYQVVEVPREYSMIVTGVGDKRLRILVDAADLAQAQSCLSSLQGPAPAAADHDESSPTPNYFKKVIILSTLGFVLLPVVFNWYATKNFLLLKTQNVSKAAWAFALLYLVMGWAFALSAVAILANSYLR